MATFNSNPCLLLFSALLISSSLVPGKDVLVAAADCQSDMRELISKFEAYVGMTGPEIPPSDACCRIVREVDVSRVCGLVAKRIESIISMEKVVPSGAHCRSYVVPRNEESKKDDDEWRWYCR